MSAIEKVFFPLPAFDPRATAAIRWWEGRRPLYNAVVGLTGTFTLGVLSLLSLLAGWREPIPWQPVVAYALAANVCYSFGWLAEGAIRLVWAERAPLIGPALFRQGLIFSIGLTLLPIPIASAAVSAVWIARIF